MTENYIPYGPEWEKEMSKFPKAQLIKRLGKALQQSPSLPNESGDDVGTEGKCPNCGVEFRIHKSQPEEEEMAKEQEEWWRIVVNNICNRNISDNGEFYKAVNYFVSKYHITRKQ